MKFGRVSGGFWDEHGEGLSMLEQERRTLAHNPYVLSIRHVSFFFFFFIFRIFYSFHFFTLFSQKLSLLQSDKNETCAMDAGHGIIETEKKNIIILLHFMR